MDIPNVEKQAVNSRMATANPDNLKNPSQWKSDNRIGPNERCPCGSGKKHKKCCMNLDIILP